MAHQACAARDPSPTSRPTRHARRGYFSGGLYKPQKVRTDRLPLEKHDWTIWDGTAHPAEALQSPKSYGVSSSWFLGGLALAFAGPALLMGVGIEGRRGDAPRHAPYFPPADHGARRRVTV